MNRTSPPYIYLCVAPFSRRDVGRRAQRLPQTKTSLVESIPAAPAFPLTFLPPP